MKDSLRARIMQPNGTYKRLKPPDSQDGVDVQIRLMRIATERAARRSSLTTPLPHS
jgi:hypothetical protein